MADAVRPRIVWADQARGIGIILVVLGHVLRGLGASGIIREDETFRFMDSWIYSFHMPLFFLLSGLFAGRHADRRWGDFVRDRLATIAYPYLVWSVLQTLIQSATGRYTNHGAGVGDLAGILVEPIMQFWFLYALLLIVLMYDALRRFGLGPLAILAAFALFWATQGRLSLGDWSPLHAARMNGIYYAMGAVLSRIGWVDRIERASSASAAVVAVVGYAIITGWVVQHPPHSFEADTIVALCGISATIATAALLGRAGGAEAIRDLGMASLEIFVAHTIASAGTRIALQKILKVDDPAIHVAVGLLAGLFLPLCFARLCRRHRVEYVFRYPRR